MRRFPYNVKRPHRTGKLKIIFESTSAFFFFFTHMPLPGSSDKLLLVNYIKSTVALKISYSHLLHYIMHCLF